MPVTASLSSAGPTSASPTTNGLERLLSLSEVARLLNYSVPTIRGFVDRGLLVPLRLGPPGQRCRLKFEPGEVRKFISSARKSS